MGGAFYVGMTVVPALQGKQVPPWLWLVALAAALLPASYLAWREERRKVEQLEARIAAGPRISVKVVESCLAVHNLGPPAATFWATIRVLSHGNCHGRSLLPEYDGSWEYTAETGVTIGPGTNRNLCLGGVRREPAASACDMALVLYHSTPHIMGRDESRQPYLLVSSPPMEKPWIVVKVTITSSPPLAEGWSQTYRLSAEKGIELFERNDVN
jgi:hypothetical protein